MDLTVTLCTAAAAALLNIWLGWRIGRLRYRYEVIHGDGDNPHLMKRMRAQANFVETAPFVLVLIAALELTGPRGLWLAVLAALYIIGRLLHPFGMEADKPHPLRAAGTIITMLALFVLSVAALLEVVEII